MKRRGFALVELPVVSSVKRAAFTLVELLVVIGIIAVLVGILLPTLGRARDAAERTVCLSNLRQLWTSIYQYSIQYKDVALVGYFGPPGTPSSPTQQKQWNYLANMNRGGLSFPTCMGLLVDAKLAGDGKAFYCPSERNPQWMHNTARNPTNPLDPGNPWPFDRIPRSYVADTRLGYGTRPVVPWPWYTEYAVGKRMPNPIPRLTKLKNKAVLADLVCFPQQINVRHKKGINVLYGNGGAKWVDRKALGKGTASVWLRIGYDSFDHNFNQYLLNGDETSGIWVDMDRQ